MDTKNFLSFLLKLSATVLILGIVGLTIYKLSLIEQRVWEVIFIITISVAGVVGLWLVFTFVNKINTEINVQSSEKTQEIAAAIAQKALETTIAVSQQRPTLNMLNMGNNPQKQLPEGNVKSDGNVITGVWEKG
jgi:hypothetical protein